MNSLVGQSFVNQVDIKAEASEDDTDAPLQSTAPKLCTREDKQALTVFGGNPSNPRHLFSSLQKSVKVPLSESEPEKFVEVQEALRETALPNGITTTKVVPYNLDAASTPKRTFGDVFAPRTGLPQLEPPRKRSIRHTSSLWIDPFDAMLDAKSFLGERNNYSLAPLPSGQWLQYGGVTSSPSYWTRIEKHGDTDGGQRHRGDPALWTADDTSLLQGVYSSFAPSFDSSGAVLQADLKDLVWWGKRGAKRLRTLLSLPYMEKAQEDAPTVPPRSIGELDESTLEQMVQSFNPDDFADNVMQTGPAKDEDESKDVEEMLGDVAELLETLSSYQRVRNINLPPSGDQDSDSKEPPAPDFGTPSSASEAEKAIYETLKSSLATLIGNLPPHTVAKLDGDQLAELNISQKILTENPEYSGTMEKDDFILHQERAAAMAAASNSANRTSTPSTSRSGTYQGSHGAYNQRAYASNARASQPQGGFQVQAQHHGRQPSGTYTPGHSQAYGGGRPPNTASQRPGYAPQYSQMTPQYSQANHVPQFQRPTPNGYPPYSAQSGQPSAQASPYTPRPSQAGAYNQSYTAGQSTSPRKQPSYATPQGNPTEQQPSQYGSYANSGAATIHTRSAAEQAALMDRNRAQLAAARQSRQSPSTPQPPLQSVETRSQERSATPAHGTPVPS